MADNAGRIDSLSIEIGASSDKAVKDIEKVINALKRLKTVEADAKKGAGNGASEKVSEAALSAMSKIDLLRLKLKEMQKELSRKMSLGKIDTKSAADAMLKIKNLQDEINRKSVAPKFDDSVSLGDVFKNMARDISQANKQLNIFSSLLHGAASVAKTLVTAIVNIVKNVAKIGFNMIKSAITGIVNVVKTLGKLVGDIAKRVPGMISNLIGLKKIAGYVESIKQGINALSRIAVYRIARTAIKEVTEAFKEGSERAYFYAKQYGIATKYIADSLDTLSSGSFKMSNQLGAAWATFLSVIQPVLIQVINLATAAAEAVTRLFALFGGAGTYLKAKDYTHAWADETEKGAKAAKEWRNQLLGFDEINRLTEPSSSSGGAGDLYKDYQNMFEEMKISGDFYDQVKTAIENGDWSGLGKILGDKFNALVNNADFAGFGKKIGEKVSAAIETSYSFLKEANFRNLGKKIAEFLDNMGDEINFNTLGRLVTRIRTAIWDVLYGAFTNPGSMAKLASNLSDYVLGTMQEMADWLRSVDPVEVADAIRDFFGNIKYGEIRDTLKDLLKTAWEKAVALKNEIWNDETKERVKEAIRTFFDDIKWREIWYKIRDKLGWVWQQITSKFDEIWPPEERDKFKEQMKEKLTGILKEAMEMASDAAFDMLPRRLKILFYDDGNESGASYVAGVEKSIEDGKKGINTSLDEGIVKPSDSAMVSFLKNIGLIKTGYALEADEINKVSDTVKDTTTGDYDTIDKDVTKKMTSMKVSLGVIFGNIKAATGTVMEGLKNTFNTVWDTISTKTESAVAIVNTKVQSAWASIRQNTSTIWSGIRTELQNIWNGINTTASTVWNTLKTVASSTWNAIRTESAIAWSSVSAAASSAWGSMLSTASSVASSIVGVVSSMVSAIANGVSSIRSWLSDAVDYAANAGRSIGNSLENAYNNARNTASNVYNNVANTVNSTVSNVLNKIKVGASKLTFASGGFPEDGLFFANHTELVGQFSNGRTAVANNQMITQGIYEAAYAAFSDAMRQSGGNGNDKPVNIYLDGKLIAQSTTKYQRQFARAAG